MRQSTAAREKAPAVNPYVLKKPCENCPFRADVKPYLRPERAKEIAQSIRDGGEFHCHKTTVTVEDEETGFEETATDHRSLVCAGAIGTMENEEQPNQMLRMAERLGMYESGLVDTSNLHPSLSDWVKSYQPPVPTVTTEDGEVLEYEHCGVVGDDCEDPPGFGGSFGVMESEDEPTCDPTNSCSACGSVMCSACTAEPDEDGYPQCVNCAENNDEEED